MSNISRIKDLSGTVHDIKDANAGTATISSIGDGTYTGAISALHQDLGDTRTMILNLLDVLVANGTITAAEYETITTEPYEGTIPTGLTYIIMD